MDKINWIKDLVKQEKQMEETGLVDVSSEFDPQRHLIVASVDFLLALKDQFTEAVNVFNELRGNTLGRIKIYGIAKTHADFMIFRNGFKLIFSFKQPGVISVRFNFLTSGLSPQPGTSALVTASANAQNLMDEDVIEARWGSFNEIIWTYKGQPIKSENLVKHYLTKFIKESAK